MKPILIIGGIIVLVIAILPLNNLIQKYKASKEGILVWVTITSLPNDCTQYSPYRRKNHFMDFTFEGKSFTQMVYCKEIAGLANGQQVEMKHLDNTNVFVLINQHFGLDLFFETLLGAFATSMILYGKFYKQRLVQN